MSWLWSILHIAGTTESERSTHLQTSHLYYCLLSLAHKDFIFYQKNMKHFAP